MVRGMDEPRRRPMGFWSLLDAYGSKRMASVLGCTTRNIDYLKATTTDVNPRQMETLSRAFPREWDANVHQSERRAARRAAGKAPVAAA